MGGPGHTIDHYKMVATALVPASILQLMPSSIVEYLFGSMLIWPARSMFPDRLLPLICCINSAAVFRFSAMSPENCKHPFVNRVYRSAGYSTEASQRSLASAQSGRYDNAVDILHGKQATIAQVFLNGFPTIFKNACKEVGALYALIWLRSRKKPPAKLLADFARTLAFYCGTFNSIRVINYSASRAFKRFPDVNQWWVVANVLPMLLSSCMVCVKAEPVARQRQIAFFTSASALTSLLRFVGAKVPREFQASAVAFWLAKSNATFAANFFTKFAFAPYLTLSICIPFASFWGMKRSASRSKLRADSPLTAKPLAPSAPLALVLDHDHAPHETQDY